MKKNKYIIVTGSAGFIGSGVTRRLNDLGMTNLVLVDDFKVTKKWQNLVGKNFSEMVSRHKIFDWLKTRESEIQAFIHLGACSSTIENDADYLMDNNYRFSRKLAEYALKNSHRFIYASSAATYGNGLLGFVDDHHMLEKLHPMNMYGFSKHLFDLWLKKEHLLDTVVGLKYFNVFGPNENHKGRMASKIYHMYNEIKEKGFVKLFKSNDPKNYKDGEQVRDFIYVKDAAKMTCDFLDDSLKNVGGIFNIGSGYPTTWNELAEAVFDALGKKADIQYIDMPVDLKGQYQNYTCADMDKFCRAFGIQSFKETTTPIKEAVKDYVQNYLILNHRW